MAYYIGVDGGGTKTVYALFDENRTILNEGRTPGSNHENLEGSYDEAAEIIFGGLTELVKKQGIALDDVSFTLMGLAGIDHPFQHDEVCSRLAAKGLKNFEIFNDGFLVVKAGSETGTAIGYNMGTGMCCNAIDRKGTMKQLAGLGEFSGDIGGGHQIAVTAWRIIYDDVMLHVAKTAMTEMFYQEFDIHSEEEFLDTVSMYEDPDKFDRFVMRLIDFFFAAADQGDAPVMAAVDALAQRGAYLIAAHANGLDFGDEVEVVLSGSIHTKLPSAVYTDLMEHKAQALTAKKLCFKKLAHAPVYGCVNWILQDYLK